jgi:hypothetical protein
LCLTGSQFMIVRIHLDPFNLFICLSSYLLISLRPWLLPFRSSLPLPYFYVTTSLLLPSLPPFIAGVMALYIRYWVMFGVVWSPNPWDLSVLAEGILFCWLNPCCLRPTRPEWGQLVEFNFIYTRVIGWVGSSAAYPFGSTWTLILPCAFKTVSNTVCAILIATSFSGIFSAYV